MTGTTSDVVSETRSERPGLHLGSHTSRGFASGKSLSTMGGCRDKAWSSWIARNSFPEHVTASEPS